MNKNLYIISVISISVISIFFIVFHYISKESKQYPLKKENIINYQTIPEGLGVSIHPGLGKKDIKWIANAGFKWVRIDLPWEYIETEKGKYDLENTEYDELNKWLKDEGMQPYYILDYSNKLYEQNRSIVTKEGREAFGRYVNFVTKRYKNQGAIWEIWNEPNTETFWNPQPNYEEYSLLVKDTVPIIKKNDKSGFVVAPALAGINSQSFSWLEKVLKEGMLKNEIDAISVHPYRSGPPEESIIDYQNLKKLIKHYASRDIPIISGEWGYSMANTTEKPLSEMEQANYLVRMIMINAQQQVPISIWYDWKNDGVDPANKEHNFGVMWNSGNPKVAFLSIQVLTKQLKGYKFSKSINYQSNKQGDYILEFVNDRNKKIIVFWTTGQSHSLNFVLKKGKGKIISMLGATREISWKQHAPLNFSNSPSYLVID
ncbi:cellulase family glycosylhydrolase [Priestia aryabhattai]|uniref:cellulase family glycosylhydrolase n=1 Tax=Priestia aryabhattai TaxID=412384 RepID=UPI003CB34BF1